MSLLFPITLVILLAVLVLVWVFLRALTARLLTGKWPHQDEHSHRIFRKLP